VVARAVQLPICCQSMRGPVQARRLSPGQLQALNRSRRAHGRRDGARPGRDLLGGGASPATD
jgi:hypothetical protein